MKKLAFILLFVVPFLVKATNYTSVASGNWSTSSTWSPAGVPGASDNVTIANTYTVTLSANESVNNFTINSGGTLTVSTTKTLTVDGNFTDNGTFTYATGTVIFAGTSNQTLGGSATLAFYKLTINNTGSSGNNSVTLGGAITTNNTLTLTAGILDVSSSNYQVTCEGTFTNNNSTTAFNAENGTVDLGGGINSITVNGSSGITFYNLTSDAGSGNTITSTANSQTITNNLVVSTGTLSLGTTTLSVTDNVTISTGATLKFSSGTLNIGGNYINNGTFTYSTSTVNFDATSTQNHNQTISGSASPMAFYNLTDANLGSTNDTLLLQCAITLHQNFTISDGVFACQTYQVTGNSAGSISMSSGTFLLLGLASSSTNVAFPSAYSSASFDPNSTVIYQANTSSQKIVSIVSSNEIEYGNLIVSAASNTITKTGVTTANVLEMNGNLTITSTVTYNANQNILLSNGGLTINGVFSCGFLEIYGNFINNGALSGTPNVEFTGSSIQTISGTASLTAMGYVTLAGDTLFVDKSISVISIQNGGGRGIVVPVTANDTITCTEQFDVSGGAFIAKNGTVILNGSSLSISNSSPTVFYNLVISPSTTAQFPKSFTVRNNLTISSGATLDYTTMPASSTVYIGNNFANNGTFYTGVVTTTFNGNTNQTIGGSGSSSFYNLTDSAAVSTDTLFTTQATTVTSNLAMKQGVLDCENYQITGNATGIMSMASGTGLVLGLPSSATAISFPTSFTTAHTTLNAGSTVTYQSNATQTVSSVPSAYGNLVLSTGSTATTKTTGSTSLTVAGNLTINSNTTLSGISGSLILGGNFTNSGTYTTSTGNVIFNGSGTQTIGGSTTTSFYNMTLVGTGTVQPSYALSLSKSLRINSGTLDVTSSNYNVTIGGSFVNNGGVFTPHSNKVTLNGSSSDTLGGSATLSVDTLTIGNSGTTYLGGNVNAGSNVTINSSTTLNGLSHTLATAGNFIDNGTFTASTGTVTFDRNGHQCIQGSSTPTFNNLTVGALSILGTTGSLNITGTVTVLPGGQMACSCSP